MYLLKDMFILGFEVLVFEEDEFVDGHESFAFVLE